MINIVIGNMVQAKYIPVCCISSLILMASAISAIDLRASLSLLTVLAPSLLKTQEQMEDFVQ